MLFSIHRPRDPLPPDDLTLPPPPLQEAILLGGRPGPRAPLETVLYEYYLARYGARQLAEMHLVAFLKAVQRCK